MINLLGEKNGIICTLCSDLSAQSAKQAEYRPDVKYLNEIIRQWQKEGITFAGIFHTHLPQQGFLSGDDIRYIEVIVQTMSEFFERLYFPIVLPRIEVRAFKAVWSNEGILICEDNLIIIEKEI